MVLRRIPAPASTVSVASDRMDPTTGTTLEMVILVSFTVMASAEPATTPVMVR